jgi:hypothetical protein
MNNKIWFTHPEGLANLAAAVSQGRTPAKAVAYALELCRESAKALDNITLEDIGVTAGGFNVLSQDLTTEQFVKQEKWEKTVPKPDKFPATLGDFFRIIVKAKTPADCTKRLRDFYVSQFSSDKDPQSKAASQIQRIKDADKQGGFFTEIKWVMVGESYLDWWKQKKSTSARMSARQRK